MTDQIAWASSAVVTAFFSCCRQIVEQCIEFSKEERMYYDCLERTMQRDKSKFSSNSEDDIEEDHHDAEFFALPAWKVFPVLP